MNLLEELHTRFKDFDRVSPALVKRYTKLHWDDCDEIAEELNEIREREKPVKPIRKKWERIK